MPTALQIAATVFATALLSAPIAAQPARTFLVVLEPAAYPARLDLLDRLRTAVSARSPRTYAAALRAVRNKHDAAIAAVRAQAIALGGQLVHDYWALGGAAVSMLPNAAATLRNHPDVASVDDDRLVGASIANLTGPANHRADSVQTLGFTGAGATLALVDSGIDLELAPGNGVAHPAFLDGAGATSRIVRAVGIADPADAEDATGHGTAVAGIAAARDWSTSAATDDGFAPDAQIASYKITHDHNNNAWVSNWIAAWHEVLADRAALGIAAAVASYSGDPDPTDVSQRIVDVVAHYGDVLIVTSAGNAGGQITAASTSQSNCNGIAVAAVNGATHDHATFSTEGPLPGDPSRGWPDLAAVGALIFAPAPNNGTGVSLPLSGTSFAAPCVAGTALLLRAADPTLDALTTKALILNSVADLSNANPHRDRMFVGLGFLRTDLAIDALQNSQRFNGVAVSPGAVQTRTVSVSTGQAYAATLVWPRTDDRTRAWNDLDLRVRDPAGQLVAVTQNPRNLYERTLFTPRVAGPHTVEIVSTTVVAPDAPWALVVAPNSGGGRQPGTFEIVGEGCAGTGRDPAVRIMPATAASGFANSRTTLPFANAPTRTQQAFDGGTIPNGIQIEALAFRRDEAHLGDTEYHADVEVLLGHTATPPTQLSISFAANPNGPMTSVYRSSTHAFAATHGLPTSADHFDYVFPLNSGFTTATGPGNHLLVEIRVLGHDRGSGPFGLWFDASDNPSLHTRLVGGPNDSTGALDSVAPVMSLITAAPSTTRRPRLDFGGDLALGGAYDIVLRDAPPQSAVALLFGIPATAVGLPVDLQAIGAPGCVLRTSIEAAIGGTAGSDGQHVVCFAIGQSTTLIGYEFTSQFVVLDMGANALGLTLTGLGQGRVGGP